MSRILVTGAGGFLGGPVCRALVASGHQVQGAVRRADVSLPAGVAAIPGPDLGADADWQDALVGVEAVVHLAARAHVMDESAADPLALFRSINRDGTLALARQAAHAGVRRFLFISSIKVNGEATPIDRPFTAMDAPGPQDAYGLSKAEAEEGLARLAAATGLECVVLRPPLVHGPKVKGNLALLLRLVASGLPLPLGAIGNRRSLVGAANLADAIRFLLECPVAAGGTFLIRDGEDVSTPELLRRLGLALGRRPWLVPVPPALLGAGLRLVGRGAMMERLAGSLVVDDAPLRALGWAPPQSLDQGLAAMAAAFLTSRHGSD